MHDSYLNVSLNVISSSVFRKTQCDSIVATFFLLHAHFDCYGKTLHVVFLTSRNILCNVRQIKPPVPLFDRCNTLNLSVSCSLSRQATKTTNIQRVHWVFSMYYSYTSHHKSVRETQLLKPLKNLYFRRSDWKTLNAAFLKRLNNHDHISSADMWCVFHHDAQSSTKCNKFFETALSGLCFYGLLIWRRSYSTMLYDTNVFEEWWLFPRVQTKHPLCCLFVVHVISKATNMSNQRKWK